MNRIIGYFLISIFSIFLGSQITEGFLLITHWKTLSATEFYDYYSLFGLIIGQFYTILTVIAALIPISISIYCYYSKSKALKHSFISLFFTSLCILLFYIYFKGTNQQFFNAALNTTQLKHTLETWEYLHWLRVLLELFALIFLILSINILTKNRTK